MSLVDWKELPVRVKRSRKRLYSVISDEFSLDSWMELPIEIKRSKKKLYDFIANELNLDCFDELPVECRRSTRLMYGFIQENGGGGSTPTLTVVVTDGADPITGATVTVDGDSETTGSDGKATFTVEYGDYEATISASGYVTKTEELKFRSNKKSFSITLESSGGGTGTVNINVQKYDDYEQEYVPVSGVNCVICTSLPPTSDNSITAGDTGLDGICSLTEVPFGNYKLFLIDSQDNTYNYDLVVDNATVTTTITLTTQE